MPSDRELLVGLVNKALERDGMDYRIRNSRDIQRIYAGYWQRSEGAARWFADAYYDTDGREGRLELVSHDLMRDCVRHGISLWFNRPASTWEVIANQRNGDVPATTWPVKDYSV